MAKPEPALEAVQMTDGRIVDFAGKRKIVKSSMQLESGALAIRVDFRNGETRTFTLNPELINKFATHGAEQKYGDEVAGVEDVEDMVLAMDDLHDRLTKGEWATKREASGIAGTSVLVRALVEFSGKSVDEIKTFLQPLSQSDKVALRNDPDLKPIVERIESEKASKGSKVDTKSILASLRP